MKSLFITLFVFFVQSANFGFGQGITWYPYKNPADQWSFLSENGQAINNDFYDSVVPFYNGLALVRKNHQWGCINNSGAYALPIEFWDIERVSHGALQIGFILTIKKDGNGIKSYGIYSADGIELLPPVFSRLDVLTRWTERCDLYTGIAAQIIQVDGIKKVGLYNFKGEELLTPIYDSILRMPSNNTRNTDDQCVYVAKKNRSDKWLIGGYNVTQQKWIFPCIYENVEFLNPYALNSSLENRSEFVPLHRGKYAMAWTGILTTRSSIDYYSLDGDFLFNSSKFDTLPTDGNYYYVVADSIVAASKSGWSAICVADSLDRYLLWFGESHGLYDVDKGYLIPSGKYRLKLSDRGADSRIIGIDLQNQQRFEFDLNGKLIDHRENMSHYDNLGLVVRNKTGEVVPMEPYRIVREVVIDSQEENYFIGNQHGKWGVVNIDKKVIIPFRYDRINYNSAYQFFYLDRKKTRTILTNQFKRTLRTRLSNWSKLESDRFVLITKNKASSIFDLKQMDYLVKGLPVLGEGIRDSLEERGVDELIKVHIYDDESYFLQCYKKESGWNYYDFEMQKLIAPPVKSYFPIYPLLKGQQFAGFIYPLNSIKDDRVPHKYQFFDGFKLVGIDTVFYMNFNQVLDGYEIEVKRDQLSFFSEEGRFCFDYSAYLVRRNGNYIVENNDGWQIYDSSYHAVFPEKFTKLQDYERFAIVSKGNQHYLLAFTPMAALSEAYERIEVIAEDALAAYLGDQSFDVLDKEGKLLIKHAVGYTRRSGYLIIRNLITEYWMTYSGSIYAQHALK